MKISKSIQDAIENYKAHDDYWYEEAKVNFAINLDKQRKFAGLSYADIANELGKSAPYVSKVFRGESNLTIESMVKLARAAKATLHIELIDEQVSSIGWAKYGKFNLNTTPSNEAYIAEPSRVTIDKVAVA